MKYVFSYSLPIIVIGLLLFSCQQPSKNEEPSAISLEQATQNPFLGSWELDRFSNQDTAGNYEVISIILFDDEYFSWMASRSDRESFEKLTEPTDEELRQAFNTFSAIAGTYEFSDSTITMTQKIVKRPNWMNPPRVEHYAYQIKDGEIHLLTRYRILEGKRNTPENPLTIVLKKK